MPNALSDVNFDAELEDEEILRWFSPQRLVLKSLRRDGVVLFRGVGDSRWRPFFHKKAEIPLDEFIENKRNAVAKLPEWARLAHAIPSVRQLEEWVSDCQCETPTGDIVEPDGHGPDGAPSWLLALGMI